MNWRDRLESGFTAWGRVVARYRFGVVFACIAVTFALGAGLPTIRFDNSIEVFLHADDPALEQYDRFREQFGTDDLIVVALEPPEIFDLGFLDWLRHLHERLEDEVPHIEEVTSLVDARHSRGDGDRLVVEGLMERPPRSVADLADLRRKVRANPLYTGRLIDAHERLTLIVLRPDTWSSAGGSEGEVDLGSSPDEEPPGAPPAYLSDAETAESLRVIERILAEQAQGGVGITLAGAPVLGDTTTRLTQRDIVRFVTLLLAVVTTILVLLFRRVLAVLIPIGVVACALIGAFGIMARLGIPLSMPLQILPSFLLAVGICDSVHLLTIFHQQVAQGASREEAVVGSLAHSGVPIVMTSVTTAAGLASFTAAEIAPVAHLGVVAPLGVMLAMAYSLTLLPALLLIAPATRRSRAPASERHGAAARFLDACAALALTRPRLVVALSLTLASIVAFGALRLRFSQDQLAWLPESDALRRATELIDERMGGAMSLELLVESGAPGALKEPELLSRLARLREDAAALRVRDLELDNTLSLVDVVEEVHQALASGTEPERRIPDSRALVAQELLLFEAGAPQDLEKLVDADYRLGRVSMSAPFVDAVHYPPFLEAARWRFEASLGEGVRLELTGRGALLGRTYTALVHSMARSYAVAILLILPLMAILLGSARIGLLAMIPNLAPIAFILGAMGWAGVPLDVFTLLIGSTLLGLVVDDTIHIFYQARRLGTRTGNPARAIEGALRSTGAALLATTQILAGGFFVFVLAYMQNLQSFGLIAGSATIVAFLADVLLAPALMRLAPSATRA